VTVLSGATELPPIPPGDGDLTVEPELSRKAAEAIDTDAVRLNRSELWFIIPTFCGNSPARRPDLPRTDQPDPGHNSCAISKLGPVPTELKLTSRQQTRRLRPFNSSNRFLPRSSDRRANGRVG
jgi:hypothetical protein